MNKKVYDLIIIGMGPAGVSAAIYAKRAGMHILCLDKSMIGGTLNFIDTIENYPGFFSITGPTLAFQMMKQVQDLDIPFLNETVIDIQEGEEKTVITKNNQYFTKRVLIATGRFPISLGLEHEEELLGKGLSHCALCDGNFFKGLDVAVVGGGISALQEALYLANICKHVTIIHRGSTFKVSSILEEKVSNTANITLCLGHTVKELCVENGKLSGIILDDDTSMSIKGLFTYIGYKPGTKFMTQLPIFDKDGYIKVNENFETEIPGIFAVGDILKKDVYQIVIAVSEGAIAATYISKNLKN